MWAKKCKLKAFTVNAGCMFRTPVSFVETTMIFVSGSQAVGCSGLSHLTCRLGLLDCHFGSALVSFVSVFLNSYW